MRHVTLILFLIFAHTARADDWGALFVAGYASTVDPNQVGRTFTTQKALLDAIGVPWDDVRVASLRPYPESVPSLLDAAGSVDWDKILIVSHSMGGCITLETLLRHPELQERLLGWIPYQSPFYGASLIDRSFAPLRAVDWFGVWRAYDWTGAGRAALAMSAEERIPYMRRNDHRVRSLTARKPVVYVSSRWAYSLTDKLVPTSSMALPGGAVEEFVEHASHLELAIGGHGSRERQGEVFSSALRKVADRARRIQSCSFGYLGD
jgi:pimeloyl-ACP methyl ester carboxylesterase